MTNVSDVIRRDPQVLGGTPVFKGTRVPVRILIDWNIASVVIACSIAPPCFGQVPAICPEHPPDAPNTSITYQGRLSDAATGNPVPDALYAVVFRLLDEDGNEVFGPFAQMVQTVQGLFQTLVDFGDEFDCGERRFVEVSVNGQVQGAPQEVTATPRALVSKLAFDLRLPFTKKAVEDFPFALIDLTNNGDGGILVGSGNTPMPMIKLANGGTGPGLLVETNVGPGEYAVQVLNDQDPSGEGGAFYARTQCRAPVDCCEPVSAAMELFNEGPGAAAFISGQAGADWGAVRIFNRGGRAMYLAQIPEDDEEPVPRAPDIAPQQFAATGGGETFAAASSVITNLAEALLNPRLVSGSSGFAQQYWGVYGDTPSGVAVMGYSGSSLPPSPLQAHIGVAGVSDMGIAVYGSAGNPGLFPTPGHFAGYFDGPVHVDGSFTVGPPNGDTARRGDANVTIAGNLIARGSKQFRIDHPLDPQHKTLSHACVESDQMLTIYRGNVLLDEHGRGTVNLPEWFEALNGDFGYQLTPIGAAASDLHVAGEIADNSFEVAGGKPNMKVSWVVTGVRRDAFALEHPLQVESAKE